MGTTRVKVIDAIGDVYEIPLELEETFRAMDNAFQELGICDTCELLYDAYTTLFKDFRLHERL